MAMVVDPWGLVIATAPDIECCITTTIDLDFIDEIRARYPLIDQRRPSLYGIIGKEER